MGRSIVQQGTKIIRGIANFSRNPTGRVALAVSFFVSLLVFWAPNDMTGADPTGSLLSAQAVLQTGSLDLSPYPNIAKPSNYKFEEHNDGVYYYLGFGPSILSLPVVFVANRLGWDMSTKDEKKLQRILAALIVGGVLYLISAIGSLLLPLWVSVSYGVIVVLGSSLSSTLGTAFWNMGFECLGILAALYFVMRSHVKNEPLKTFLVGLLLGLALFSRPTALLPVGLGGLYVLWRGYRGVSGYVLGVSVWVVLILSVSHVEFGKWIPTYYMDLGMDWTWAPDIVLQGLLVSPSRGFFIFSPLFLFLIFWNIFRRDSMKYGMFGNWFILWFCLHVFFLLRFNHWWGGHCFGPRLMTDIVPAMVPVGIFVIMDIRNLRKGLLRQVALGIIVVLAMFGLDVHLVRGLYSPETVVWNSRPNIDPNSRFVFDWRFPQPWENPQKRLARQIDADLPQMKSLPSGMMVGADNPNYLWFYGWTSPQQVDQKSILMQKTKDAPVVAFVFQEGDGDSVFVDLSLAIDDGAVVHVVWNRHKVTSIGPGNGRLQRYRFRVGPEILNSALHRGTDYFLVPEALRIPYGGKVAQEVRFKMERMNDENGEMDSLGNSKGVEFEYIGLSTKN